jgi:hypothetical protein
VSAIIANTVSQSNARETMTTATVAAATRRTNAIRTAYAGLSAVLLLAALVVALRHGTGYWQLPVFALGPDVALLLGAAPGLERGRLHPRAVRSYNTLHRFAGPFALAVLAAPGWIPSGYLVGALAWGFHLALDRSLGYGLRARDGFQRR